MTRISNILVPVDFSAASRKAMVYGTHLALKFGTKLTAAHIIPPVGGSIMRFLVTARNSKEKHYGTQRDGCLKRFRGPFASK